MTGRLPTHSNIYNDDPAMPGAGAPVQFRLMPAVLKQAGYATHFVGKWHLGMASRSAQIPVARGFDTVAIGVEVVPALPSLAPWHEEKAVILQVHCAPITEASAPVADAVVLESA